MLAAATPAKATTAEEMAMADTQVVESPAQEADGKTKDHHHVTNKAHAHA